MLRELIVGFSLFASNIVMHGLGTFVLMHWILRVFQVVRSRALSFLYGIWVLIRFLIAFSILHVLEAAVWAEFYFRQHCFVDRETAFYFSLGSYTTVGYSDVVLPHGWRLLGGLEAISGVLLFGWSTAGLVAILVHFREARERNQSSPPRG